jgi:uncharacterized protein
MALTLHPANIRMASPWKNGRGVTRELAVFPPGAGMDDFEWRVSIAEVSEGGPFSEFPGVDRTLAVLDGTLRLSIGGETAIVLSPGSEPLAFPGDRPCQAEILGSVVRDLNVMTRRGRFSSHMALVEIDGAIAVLPQAHATLLVALCDLVVEIDQSVVTLKPLDAVSIDEPMAGKRAYRCRRLDGTAGTPSFYVIRLFRDERP